MCSGRWISEEEQALVKCVLCDLEEPLFRTSDFNGKTVCSDCWEQLRKHFTEEIINIIKDGD